MSIRTSCFATIHSSPHCIWTMAHWQPATLTSWETRMFHAKMAPRRFAAKEPSLIQFLNIGLTFHVEIQRQFWFTHPFERTLVAHEWTRRRDDERHHAIILVEFHATPLTFHDVPPATLPAQYNVPQCNPGTTNRPAFSARKYLATSYLCCDSNSNLAYEFLHVDNTLS